MIVTQPKPAPGGQGRDTYWEKFERRERQSREPAWLLSRRRTAMGRFGELGFPTLHDEDWRFTNVTPIARLPFVAVDRPPDAGAVLGRLGSVPFSTLPAVRLVFVNGHFCPGLSSEPARDGICVANLARVLAEDPEQIEPYLAGETREEGKAFSALNTAFFQDGAFVYLPAGTALERPVQVIYLATAQERGATWHPRNLVVAGPGSRATVMECYVSATNEVYFTNAVTELFVGDGARVEHVKFQDEGLESFHVATLQLEAGRSADVIAHSVALGARLSRNAIYTTLSGAGTDCVLNGLYLTRGEQLADHFMVVEHAQPHCNSHEYFNGILDERSRGVFHGRILVRPAAQKTDAKQTNRNLLLTDEATVNTKPQLEIYADDVRCTHGATVGQMDEESIFYLRARGLGEERARRMLMHAFAGEIIDRLRWEAARAELDRLVWDRLEQNERIKVDGAGCGGGAGFAEAIEGAPGSGRQKRLEQQ